jgi:4-amino-4-deoxy-L-arabinose transferase-like glycosyltransferase
MTPIFMPGRTELTPFEAARVAARSWRGRLSRDGLLIALVVIVALALRVAYVLHTPRFVPTFDAKSYNALGAGLASGHGWIFDAWRPPGYPFYLAAIYLVLGIPHGTWTDVRLFEAVVSALTAGLIGWLAFQVAGRRAMLVAMAIAAVYVPLVLVGVSMMSESVLVPLVLASVNCALRYRANPSRRRWVALAGLFAGLAALTHANGFVTGIALAFVVWTGRPRFSRGALAAPAILLAVMVLTIMPWTIRNAFAEHAFVPVSTELGQTLGGTYNETSARLDFLWRPQVSPPYHKVLHARGISDATRDTRMISAVLTFLSHHPTYVLQATFWNTVRLLDLWSMRRSRESARIDLGASAGFANLGVASFWIFGLLAIVGAFTSMARRIPRALWLVPLLFWLSVAPINVDTPRFRTAIDPFVILLASCALATTWEWLLRRRHVANPHAAPGVA